MRQLGHCLPVTRSRHDSTEAVWMAEREDRSQEKLFRTEPVPGKPGSGRLFDERPVTPEPVECLGMTFESEAERRTYFLDRLKEKLPELRKRPDFPVGEDDDILRLSDPPWYTACPNPFLAEFVEHHGRPYVPDEPYHREPFAVDVSEGKTDPLYRAHGYHTKVPHRADRALDPALHQAGGPHPGRLLRRRHDRGGGRSGARLRRASTAPRSRHDGRGRADRRPRGVPATRSWAICRPPPHSSPPTTRRPSTSMPSTAPAGACSTTWKRTSAGCTTRSMPTAGLRGGSTIPCGARCSPAQSARARSCSFRRRSTGRPWAPVIGSPARTARSYCRRTICNALSGPAPIRRRANRGNASGWNRC